VNVEERPARPGPDCPRRPLARRARAGGAAGRLAGGAGCVRWPCGSAPSALTSAAPGVASGVFCRRVAGTCAV